LADINHDAIVKAAALVKERFPTSEAIGIKCDVSKEQEVKAMVHGAVDQFGRLDVLVSFAIAMLPTSKTDSDQLAFRGNA
jgi:NAD(P)-dependent dehydrogenase (short-subunit alcohol dehydrogenase family)